MGHELRQIDRAFVALKELVVQAIPDSARQIRQRAGMWLEEAEHPAGLKHAVDLVDRSL